MCPIEATPRRSERGYAHERVKRLIDVCFTVVNVQPTLRALTSEPSTESTGAPKKRTERQVSGEWTKRAGGLVSHSASDG
ncbi:hypothetical protein J6590_001874 [Homalodisca vitripennis]|nr:hypothetical protein J6590_001874 [Homalodisca vitripennis]